MILQDLIIRLRTRLNDDNINENGEYKDSELEDVIKLAVNEFSSRTNCYFTTESVEYTVDNILNEIHRPISVSVGETVLKFADQRSVNDLYDPFYNAEPRYFTFVNGKINIFPTQSGHDYTLVVSGYGTKDIRSTGEELDFFTLADEPYFVLLCEIYARSTRAMTDANMALIDRKRQEVEHYYQIRGITK